MVDKKIRKQIKSINYSIILTLLFVTKKVEKKIEFNVFEDKHLIQNTNETS